MEKFLANAYGPDAYLYACPTPAVIRERYSIQEVPPCARTMIIEAILSQITRHAPTAGAPDVSVDRHHTINHEDPSSFFNDHRSYLHAMEAAVAKVLPENPWMPYGRLPYWDPSEAMPAEFVNAIALSPQFCESSRTCSDGWAVTLFARPDFTVGLPPWLQDEQLCSYPTLEMLHHHLHDWHDGVHTGVSGMFRTLDSPAAAIFWPWHTRVDMLYAKWEACHH